MAQWYCSVNGQRFGPVSEDVMEGWVAQGRVKPTDLVWSEGMPDWTPAGKFFSAGGPQAPSYAKPHRGTLILIFGILSWFVCVLFGIAAWVMGNNDLAEMRQGIMDRSGEGLTTAGRILGMISTIIAIVVLGVAIIVALLSFGLAVSHHR